MNYFIVDDDPAVRAILTNIVESRLNGTVIGTESDGSRLTPSILISADVDIVLLDLLMPERDGLDTLEVITPTFNGKTVMISQIETKEIIASAYERHIDAYITKPVNQLEVSSVLKRIEKQIRLETSLKQIHTSLSSLTESEDPNSFANDTHMVCPAEEILTDLGIRHEKGSEDLLMIIQTLHNESPSQFQSMKDLLSLRHTTDKSNSSPKDLKATEQRIRRAIIQSFHHITSIGAIDHTHPTFDYYAMKYFEPDQIHQQLQELTHGQGDRKRSFTPKINIKRFIMALYDDCRQKSTAR